MATGTGLDAQAGYKAESTYNTGVVVDRFIPLVSETLKKDINPIESGDIITGRQVMTSQQWAQGNAVVGGEVQHELYNASISLLFKQAFGTVSTSGTGPYTHRFFPATPSGISFTTQVGRPLVYGTVQPFTYTGCKIQSWEIAGQAGKFLTWGMNVVAAEEYMGTALASASYATNLRRWAFHQASVTVDGTTVPVKSYRIGGENNLADDRRFLGSTIISEPLRQDLANYTGEFAAEWGNPSSAGTNLYARYREGTEATLIATLVSGTLLGTITANVRFDDSTPNVAGRGVVEHPIPFKAVASGSLDSHAIDIRLVTDDSAA